MINVTQPYLPAKEKYLHYVERIYESKWLTNNGPLVQELEERLAKFLGVKHIILVSSGSMALQVAYQALELQGQVITTPFTFMATANTMLWQNCQPVFSDINQHSFNLDSQLAEKKINKHTSAIVPVHVFGNPCDVEAFAELGKKYKLPIIYDASHAFAVNYQGQSLLNYGDISTISFHATKIFHTIEGGAIIVSDDDLAWKIRRLINFGIEGQYKIKYAGINAKMNEFEAAMGHCLLDDIEFIHSQRKRVWDYYQQSLSGYVSFQVFAEQSNNNYCYAPVLFDDEETLLFVEKCLNKNGVSPRRYFYPALDSLDYMQVSEQASIAKEIASRIMCLPIYPTLTQAEQDIVISTIIEALQSKAA